MQITYDDKVTLNENTSIADTNKVKASDMNMIKQVVNANQEDVGNIANLKTADMSSVVNAINEIYNQLEQGFKMYLDSNTIVINPTVDVYAMVEASWGIWGYAGAEVSLDIATPLGATLIKKASTNTNGHDTEAVPVSVVGYYLLPAGGSYTFIASISIGASGGVKGSFIKAITIPKIN